MLHLALFGPTDEIRAYLCGLILGFIILPVYCYFEEKHCRAHKAGLSGCEGILHQIFMGTGPPAHFCGKKSVNWNVLRNRTWVWQRAKYLLALLSLTAVIYGLTYTALLRNFDSTQQNILAKDIKASLPDLSSDGLREKAVRLAHACPGMLSRLRTPSQPYQFRESSPQLAGAAAAESEPLGPAVPATTHAASAQACVGIISSGRPYLEVVLDLLLNRAQGRLSTINVYAVSGGDSPYHTNLPEGVNLIYVPDLAKEAGRPIGNNAEYYALAMKHLSATCGDGVRGAMMLEDDVIPSKNFVEKVLGTVKEIDEVDADWLWVKLFFMNRWKEYGHDHQLTTNRWDIYVTIFTAVVLYVMCSGGVGYTLMPFELGWMGVYIWRLALGSWVMSTVLSTTGYMVPRPYVAPYSEGIHPLHNGCCVPAQLWNRDKMVDIADAIQQGMDDGLSYNDRADQVLADLEWKPLIKGHTYMRVPHLFQHVGCISTLSENQPPLRISFDFDKSD